MPWMIAKRRLKCREHEDYRSHDCRDIEAGELYWGHRVTKAPTCPACQKLETPSEIPEEYFWIWHEAFTLARRAPGVRDD